MKNQTRPLSAEQAYELFRAGQQKQQKKADQLRSWRLDKKQKRKKGKL